MTNKLFALPVLMGALFIAGTTQEAHAEPEPTDTQGITELNLDVDPVADIQNVTASVTLVPKADDYRQDYVEQLNAISFNVFSNVNYKVTAAGDETEGLKSEHIGLRKNAGGNYVLLNNTSAVDVFTGTTTSNSGQPLTVDVQITLPDANSVDAYTVGEVHSNDITFTVETVED